MTARHVASDQVPVRQRGEIPEFGIDAHTERVLTDAVQQLREAKAPCGAIEALEGLSRQVGQPCVVAVAGQMNAGKSSFINALLRDDCAVVGNTETTATINHFVYGEPAVDRPVVCHWRGGHKSEESREFLNALQGNDLATLQRAEGIQFLEYRMPNPILKRITIVDTPGVGATVREHESRTADFLGLTATLRERHASESRRIESQADAVVYLIGAVARTSDRDVLEQFVEASQGKASAMNALGVIAKTDLSDELMNVRHELAAKVARQLDRQVNTVLPVSAAISRALDRLTAGRGPVQLLELVERVSAGQMELLCQNEEIFCGYELDGLAVSASERRELFDALQCPWSAFVRILAETKPGVSPDALRQQIQHMSGFERLHDVLRANFFQRSSILRCHRIMRDARRVLDDLRFAFIVQEGRRAARENARLARFLSLIEGLPHDSPIMVELRQFLQDEQRRLPDIVELEKAWQRADVQLSEATQHLAEYNADFSALQELDLGGFTEDEENELRALLGLYGLDTQHRLRGAPSSARCLDGQLHWRILRDRAARGSARQRIADRAHSRLGRMLDELVNSDTGAQ